MNGAGLMLVYLALFVGILLVFDGLVQVFLKGRDEQAAVNRRLRLLASGADPDEVLKLLRRRRQPSALDRIPLLGRWQSLVIQSGINVKPDRLFGYLLMAGFGFLLTFMLFGVEPVVAVPVVLAGSIGLPVMVLAHWRSRRADALTRQLPDSIDLMVRSLRAGHPLNAAFQVIAREMPDPIGSELGIVADAITYGDDLTDAVLDFADRAAIEDARYLAVAITIQAGTGGNLARVLESLSQVIRNRFAMMRKIKALSAEGRITAVIVSSVPPLIFAALNLLSPTYYGDVADDPLYLPFLMSGAVLTVINAIVLRRLVRFHF